jgi:hypothetical protein
VIVVLLQVSKFSDLENGQRGELTEPFLRNLQVIIRLNRL